MTDCICGHDRDYHHHYSSNVSCAGIADIYVDGADIHETHCDCPHFRSEWPRVIAVAVLVLAGVWLFSSIVAMVR